MVQMVQVVKVVQEKLRCHTCDIHTDGQTGGRTESGKPGGSGGPVGPGGLCGSGDPCGPGGLVGPGSPGGPSSSGGPGGVSGHLTYRHLTYTGVCRSYVRFVQKKQTYDLQTPVILVMNSVGVMSICEVLSRLKSLKKLPPLSPLTD